MSAYEVNNHSFQEEVQMKKKMSSMFGNKMINVVSNANIGAVDSISGSELAVEEKDLSIIRGFIGEESSQSVINRSSATDRNV
jgi:hypothetical protein